MRKKKPSKVWCNNANRGSHRSLDAIRKYTKEHEWIDLSADKKTGVLGISEYAAKQLGDIVYVELPEEGKDVQAGDAIGAVGTGSCKMGSLTQMRATAHEIDRMAPIERTGRT